jgi:acyl-CoA reductase-like NAD-dependent aldehyde dehydrogenase
MEAQHDRFDRFIAPTILVNVSPDSPVMQEETFGPILQVLEVDSVQEVLEFVNARPSPLALYLFAGDSGVKEHILNLTTSGGAVMSDHQPSLSCGLFCVRCSFPIWRGSVAGHSIYLYAVKNWYFSVRRLAM